MPHDGLDDGAGPAVVQTIVGTCETATQTATPQRRGAAPASTDVVDHKQAMLNQVGIRPDGLVGVLRQHAVGTLTHLLGVSLRAGIHPHIVRARSPLNDSRFGKAGFEPAVIGATLALGENQLSEAIEGNSGVFVVKTGSANNSAEEFQPELEKAQIAYRNLGQHYQKALQLIEAETEIKDNRARFQ